MSILFCHPIFCLRSDIGSRGGAPFLAVGDIMDVKGCADKLSEQVFADQSCYFNNTLTATHGSTMTHALKPQTCTALYM